MIGQLCSPQTFLSCVILTVHIFVPGYFMLQKLLVDQRISTSHICICLFDVHDKCIITDRLAQGKCHYLSSCTKESAQLLGLREGKHVLALCKATAVDISADNPALVESRDNQIVGAVLRSEREDKGGECTIQLPSGLTIVGFARPSHGLHIGMRAVATVAPEAVVIALNS